MNEQRVAALMAALMGEGVTPAQIQSAVSRARRLQLGKRISDLAGEEGLVVHEVVAAFIFQETSRLMKS